MPTAIRQLTRSGALALAVIAAVASIARAGPGHDAWYVLELNNQRAGWTHDTVVYKGDELISRNDTQLSIKRGPMTIEVTITSEFVETADFKPLRWTVTQAIGAAPSTTTFVFSDDTVQTTVGTGPDAKTTTKPLPEVDWLTPGATEAFVSRRLAGGAKLIEYQSLDPSTGLNPVKTTIRVFERAPVEALGKVVQGYRYEMTTSAAPGMTTTGTMDESGRTIRSELAMGGLGFTMIAADRELALAELDPPEMMRSLLIRASNPIPNARRARHASFILRVPDGQLPEIPVTGIQHVERIDDQTARVTIDVRDIAPATLDGSPQRYLAATELADCQDADVAALAQIARGTRPDQLARQLRNVVAQRIEDKDLGVGFATASEVVDSRQGDCTEHAVLLAAVLRARGVPSRVVSGLVYADGFLGADQIFGYHMWTQALLEIDGEQRWVDLDATLPLPGPIDATHIALAISDLADGESVNSMVALVPLLGRLSVEVESVE